MTFGSRLSLVIALVVGGIAAFLVREVLQTMTIASERAAMTSTMVVARKTIPFGAPLSSDNLQEVPWMSADPLEGSFAKPRDLLKDGRRIALVTIQPNEPVLESRVTGPNQRATLSTQLTEGMRAVTIRVDEVRGVAGFVSPGDRVDVIATRGEGGGGEAEAFADLLLQNVKVLAVDQLADERQDKPTVARAVTLEVSVNGAQKVILAQGIGRLSLALRQPNAMGDDASTRVTVGDLGGDGKVAHDKISDLEKRLSELKASEEAARAQSERTNSQKLAELSSRLVNQAASPTLTQIKPQPPKDAKSSVVNVIRNGSKTESYTVSAER